VPPTSAISRACTHGPLLRPLELDITIGCLSTLRRPTPAGSTGTGTVLREPPLTRSILVILQLAGGPRGTGNDRVVALVPEECLADGRLVRSLGPTVRLAGADDLVLTACPVSGPSHGAVAWRPTDTTVCP